MGDRSAVMSTASFSSGTSRLSCTPPGAKSICRGLYGCRHDFVPRRIPPGGVIDVLGCQPALWSLCRPRRRSESGAIRHALYVRKFVLKNSDKRLTRGCFRRRRHTSGGRGRNPRPLGAMWRLY